MNEAASAVLEELGHLAAGLETAILHLVVSGYEPLEVETRVNETIEGLRRLRLPVLPDLKVEVASRSPRLLRVEAEAEAMIEASRAEAENLLRQARLDAERLTEQAEQEAASLLAGAQVESRAAVLQGIREAGALLARAQRAVGVGRSVDRGAADGGALDA